MRPSDLEIILSELLKNYKLSADEQVRFEQVMADRKRHKQKRVDIVTSCKPGKFVYRTWTQVVAAVLRGERVIKTSRKNTVQNTYHDDGSCKTVGCYSNELCRLLRKKGITDIRYGSPSIHLKGYTHERGNTYTLYI